MSEKIKPKTLYRLVVNVWSDSPINMDYLESMTSYNAPDYYWVYGDEEEMSDPAQFPRTEFFDREPEVLVTCKVPAYVHKHVQAPYEEHKAWRCVDWDDEVNLDDGVVIKLTSECWEVVNDDRWYETVENDEGEEETVQQCSIGVETLALVTRRVPKAEAGDPDFWKKLDWGYEVEDFDVTIRLDHAPTELVEIKDITNK